MPTRVCVPQRIVEAIRIPVQTLRIGRVGNYAIRADEPPYGSVVIPCIVVIQPRLIQSLTRKQLVCGQRSGGAPGSAEREISYFAHLSAACIRGHAGGAEVVGVQILQRSPFPEGDLLAAEEVVGGDLRGGEVFLITPICDGISP